MPHPPRHPLAPRATRVTRTQSPTTHSTRTIRSRTIRSTRTRVAWAALAPLLLLVLIAATDMVSAAAATGPAAGIHEMAGEGGRGVVLADFESGEAELSSYSGEDRDPEDWEVTGENTHGGSLYSLRLFGNTWKSQAISAHPVTRASVFSVSAFVHQTGEIQSFGLGDGQNVLFYSFAGTQLQTGENWEVAYQGAFPESLWNTYLLPVGRDWWNRFGYEPAVVELIYVNDRDGIPVGQVLFDDIIDVTSDLPEAPLVEIVRGRQDVESFGSWYRVGVRFESRVEDPDSDTFLYRWDFGDSTTSEEPAPYHEFLVEADYTYTVTLGVRDETGLWGRDSAQVRVDPGGPGGLMTINFVGDVMLARGYDVPGGLIDTYGPEYVFAPTRPIFGEDADINVCNLECPLTDEGEPHPTKSYVFRGRPENIAGLTYAGIDLVSLANNHIIDYGQRGMEETVEVLDAAPIRWYGAGDNEYIALQPSFWSEQGVALGFFGQCNRTGREYNYQPFLDAACNKPGFAWHTDYNTRASVSELLPLADLVIAQLHAGIEYATGPGTGDGQDGVDGVAGLAVEPPHDAAGPVAGMPEPIFATRPSLSDRQLRYATVDAGAHLLICHHPHVLQGFEVYNGVLIAHSLGNFAFDQSFAETFPSIVLKATFDKAGFHDFTFRPVFIDDMVPQPATGRLGRSILDLMAEYSREMDTTVLVDSAGMQARILLDPSSVQWQRSPHETFATLEERDGWWTSPPIPIDGREHLSRILEATGPGAVEVRYGRELLWHGDFEAEGATLWNLNSESEQYDETVVHQGLRSLRQDRSSDNQGPVTTDLQGYPAVMGGPDFTVMGWIRTRDANQAGFAARMYTRRGSGLLGSFEAGPPVSGTNDWTFLWRDFTVEEEAFFLNVRASMEKPPSGDASAWYDELRLISWEPWNAGPWPADVPFPGNIRYVQLRATQPGSSARLVWEGASPEEFPSWVANDSRIAPSSRLHLAAPRPNPFSKGTTIEYLLTEAGRARLAVYDLQGRCVARLADGPQAAGPHRIQWSPGGLAAGLYFCRLEAEGRVRSQKLVVLR